VQNLSRRTLREFRQRVCGRGRKRNKAADGGRAGYALKQKHLIGERKILLYDSTKEAARRRGDAVKNGGERKTAHVHPEEESTLRLTNGGASKY